jgi:large subunit ribosomal protein L29
MTINELKEMNVTELKKELIALLREQFNLRMQHATKQLAQTNNLKNVRRNIARVHTILHEKIGQAS